MTPARFEDFAGDAVSTAKKLLGQRLVRTVNGQRLAGTIVEVEAYLGIEDKAAHTFNGRRTARNESMYLPGGHAYVYMIYGIHHCLNVVCGPAGQGTAVLIRAIEPTEGQEIMRCNRAAASRIGKALRDRDLCSGPGKLAQAMQIDRTLDGEPLPESRRLWIESDSAAERIRITSGPRIGVDYAAEWASKPLRFYMTGNPHVSY